MAEIAPEILDYYARGEEDGRIRTGKNRLELLRTRDILRRVLPAAPARILDVGGGSGVHAEWLIDNGYQVTLFDPVPLHREQAGRIAGLTVRAADARRLPVADGGADAVLLLGPLYHLQDRADRVRALAEACRAVRPGGVVAAAIISRYAGLHDMIWRGRYQEPDTRAVIDRSVATGSMDPAGVRTGFTTAYLHDPDEIVGEFADAGLGGADRYGIEGAAWLLPDLDEWLDDERRDVLLEALRSVESAPTLLGAAAHILTVAIRP